MRYGLLFGGVDMPVADIVEVGVAAERAGIDGLYCVEAWRSGFVPAAALAAATSRVTVGPYVLNAHFRTAYAAGIEALDLDDLAGGRLRLAVGHGNRHLSRLWADVESGPAVAKMRDYVEILRRMVAARQGESVEYAGSVHSISWRQVAPVRDGDPIPVYLAAVFPRQLRTAGAVADGLALGAMVTPGYVEAAVRPAARAAAEEAGRDPDALGYAVCVMTAIDEDRERAREAGRRAVAGVFLSHPHPYYEHMLREHGFGAQLERCLAAVEAGDAERAVAAIDDEVVDTVVVWGTPQECAARLERYAGLVDEVVLTHVSARGAAGAPVERFAPVLRLVEDCKAAAR